MRVCACVHELVVEHPPTPYNARACAIASHSLPASLAGLPPQPISVPLPQARQRKPVLLFVLMSHEPYAQAREQGLAAPAQEEHTPGRCPLPPVVLFWLQVELFGVLVDAVHRLQAGDLSDTQASGQRRQMGRQHARRAAHYRVWIQAPHRALWSSDSVSYPCGLPVLSSNCMPACLARTCRQRLTLNAVLVHGTGAAA